MLSFLKSIHDALDNDSSTEIVAFYTDFSKAFDKVPHFELVQKVANIGVGGCLLEIIIDYLDNRKQFVRVDNTRSEILDVASGVPPGFSSRTTVNERFDENNICSWHLCCDCQICRKNRTIF